DGAFFGPDFPHIFLLRYPEEAMVKENFEPFVTTLFGFPLYDPEESENIRRGVREHQEV
ncbi:casein kinase II, regulatory subunit, partial [Kipferlia bialata]